MKKVGVSLLLVGILFIIGCSHSLQITNKGKYLRSYESPPNSSRLVVGLTDFSGKNNEVWFRNELIEELRLSRSTKKIVTRISPNSKNPDNVDVILDLEPRVKYSSSNLNFLINFPGFVLFTPTWNGYQYYANIDTHYEIISPKGDKIDESTIPMTYNINQSEFDRTWIIGWGYLLDPVVFPIGTGIYNSIVYDSDINPNFKRQVKDNYTDYVTTRIEKKLYKFGSR